MQLESVEGRAGCQPDGWMVCGSAAAAGTGGTLVTLEPGMVVEIIAKTWRRSASYTSDVATECARLPPRCRGRRILPLAMKTERTRGGSRSFTGWHSEVCEGAELRSGHEVQLGPTT